MGELAPNFSGITISGDSLSLVSFRGNIVLVDFWASWNQPSRRNNLATRKILEKYRALSLRKKRKFLVVQISIDTKPDLLTTAISKDNLYWKTQLCDYKGWESKYVEQFMIRRVPANFLIDTAGYIIAKDIWSFTLDTTIQRLTQ